MSGGVTLLQVSPESRVTCTRPSSDPAQIVAPSWGDLDGPTLPFGYNERAIDRSLALQSAHNSGANLFVLFAGNRNVSTVNGVVTHDALSTVRGVSYDCPDAILASVLEVGKASP